MSKQCGKDGILQISVLDLPFFVGYNAPYQSSLSRCEGFVLLMLPASPKYYFFLGQFFSYYVLNDPIEHGEAIML